MSFPPSFVFSSLVFFSFVFSNMVFLSLFFSLFDTEVLFVLVSLVGWCQFCVCVFMCCLNLRRLLHPPCQRDQTKSSVASKGPTAPRHEVTSSPRPPSHLS